MKRILLALLFATLSLVANAQQPVGLIVGGTPVIGGATGNCLQITSGTLTAGACSGGSSVTTLSGGTTGLTPNTPTTGDIVLGGTLAAANGGTGLNALGTGVATFLGTPSSANLAAAVTDETGSGALMFANSFTTAGTSTLGAAGLLGSTALSTPGQVSATPVGSGTLNTNYRYVAQACIAACTAASASMTNPVTSFATLDSTHVNQLTVAPVTNASFYRFYRTAGGSSVGYIGSCFGANCTVNDADSVTVKSTPAMATSDTGSAGMPLTGPLTVFSPAYNAQTAATNNQAGNAQFGGHFVYAWSAHDTAVGTNVILTGRMNGNTPAGGYNRALLWDIGASSTLSFIGSSGTYENPISEGSGYGLVTSGNFVTSFNAGAGAFVAMSAIDFGGYGLDSGSPMATDHDMFGRQQHWVESGRWLGIDANAGGQGNVLTSRKNYLGSSVFNTVTDLYTNGVGSFWHLVGYSTSAENSDITSAYEGAYRGFKPVVTPITAMSWASNQITIQTTAAHASPGNLKAGQWVAITGSVGGTRPNEYNGNWRVVSDNGTSIVLAGNTLNPGTATTLGNATFSGNAFYDGTIAGPSGTVWPYIHTSAYDQFTSPIVRQGYTVATLPATAAAGRIQGAMAFVTDAVACTFLATPTGGGGPGYCPVSYSGSAWIAD